MKSLDSFLKGTDVTQITKLDMLTAAYALRGGEDGADDICAVFATT